MSQIIKNAISRTMLPKVYNKHQISLTRSLCSSPKDSEGDSKIGGFAKAFEKYTAPAVAEPKPVDNETFASLLRNSKFVDMGDPVGKVVTGKIFHIVENDLYIDFGWKFHCVCTRPTKNGEAFVRGSRVKLRIKDLELSTKFLGATKDLTILEADCQLIGLANAPRSRQVAETIQ